MMEMDFMQEFTRAWQIEFPDHPHPDQDRLSACLLPPSMTSSVSSASSITSVSEARLGEIEELCVEFTAKADKLEMEARQKRFVANFLDRILLKLLRGSRSVDSASSVDSPLAPQAPMLRGTKYSLVSPMVPRGTLSKVKDALRSSGMLLDTSDEEEGVEAEEDEVDGEEEDEERGPVRLKRRAAYVGSRGRMKLIPPAPSTPPPQPCYQTPHGDGDCDSLDDYLYDSLSESDGDPVTDREKPPSDVATTLQPPATAERPPVDDVVQIRKRSDVYVSVEEIKRKKRNSRHNVGNATSPVGNPPRTLHERLSLIDGWRGDTSLPLYEQLENVTSSVDTSDVCQRRGHEKIEEENRRAHFNIEDEIEEDPYDMALLAKQREDEEEGEVDQAPQMLDRSTTGVQRRLAMSNQNYPMIGKGKIKHQRMVNMPWQFDHALMLKEAEGDIRRQELIHILKSEEMHLQVLEIMSGCRRIFLAYNVSEQKTNVIFNQVSELREIQEQFVTEMAKRLNNWKSNSTIADVLSRLDNYKALKDYITNLPNAVKVYEEVINDRREFAELLEVINMQGRSIMFRDLLQQPVMWLTKSSENIKRMIAHTPVDHPDHKPLENILHHLLGMVKSGTFGGNQKERAISMYGGLGMSESGMRTLDRHSLLVELGSNGSTRKLRHVFLFTDILVCAKPRAPTSVGTSFEIRWVIPISQIVIYRANDPQSDEMKSKRRAELETLKHRIKDIRKDIKKEMEKDGLKFEVPNSNQRMAPFGETYHPRHHLKLKHTKSNSDKPQISRSSFRRWNWAPGRRGIDKLKEQLHKTQAQLVLLSPNLEFKISSSTEKRHTLLMSSEYEKRSWTDAINALKSASDKSAMSGTPSFSDVQVLLEDYKDMVSVNKLGSCLLHDGQEGVISGILKVTIHRVEGLKEPINCIVSVEVDSFEHFDLFAKTTPVGPSCDPEVNQEFDIELDFSTTVRFIVCDESVDSEGRTTQQNIAKLELRLDVDSLSHYVETPHGLATFSDPSHSILLTLSLAYRATHETLARQLSERRGGLFGIPLEKVVRRETLRAPRGGAHPPPQVPLIIRACTEELDQRALEEPGIYRISGMSADVAKLKSSFDQNVTATSKLLEGYEVHVISGVLKAYLRELPEPLFTVERYRDFMEAFDLSPIESKREEFLRLMTSLPEPNISTARHLLRHFARINRKSDINKMVAGNLGLIFGPTLLSPASAVLPCDILSVTMESFKQSGALTFMIALTTEGRIFAD